MVLLLYADDRAFLFFLEVVLRLPDDFFVDVDVDVGGQMERPADVVAVQTRDSVRLVVAEDSLGWRLDLFVAGFVLAQLSVFLQNLEFSFNQAVDEVSEKLWSVLLVERPVLLVQFADSRPEGVGTDRAGSSLVSVFEEHRVSFVEIRRG